MKLRGYHESLQRDEQVQPGSDRAFGLFFAALFAVVAAWPALRGGSPTTWAGIVAAALAVVSVAVPSLLHPANLIWLKFGMWLAGMVSPVALALLYYGVFVPTGVLMRLAGKDPLNRALRRDVASYWIEHDTASGRQQDMRKQF